MLPEILFLVLTVIVASTMLLHHYFSSKKTKGKIPPQESVPHHFSVSSHNHPAHEGSELEVDELEHHYQKELEDGTQKILKEVEDKTVKAEEEFVQFLADLRTRADQMNLLVDEAKQEKVEQLFNKLEQNVNQVIDQTVKQTLETIQEELDASRKFVQQYSQKQLEVIDQNLIDLLEKTLSIVLIKKMTLRDQLDLVYEALEKSKVEKFLVPVDQGSVSSQPPASNNNPSPTSVPQPPNPQPPTTTTSNTVQNSK